jgi:hypothetical protein
LVAYGDTFRFTDALCLLCEKDRETIEHSILDCEQLKEVREPIIQEIDDCKLNFKKLSENVQLQLLLDITAVMPKI